MTGERYVEISKEEFESAIDEMVVGSWEELENAKSAEHIYTYKIPRSKHRVIIYSSVHKDSGVTRPVGGDAIRLVVPGRLKSDTIGRVYRTKNWKSNILKRLWEIRDKLGLGEN